MACLTPCVPQRQREADLQRLQRRTGMVKRAVSMGKEQLKAHIEQSNRQKQRRTTEWYGPAAIDATAALQLL